MDEQDLRKQAAWILFVYEKMSAVRVAKELGIPAGTVNRWCYLGGWAEQRSHPPQPKPPMPTIPAPKEPVTPKTETPAIPVTATIVPDDPEPPKEGMLAEWKEQSKEHKETYAALRQLARFHISTLTKEVYELRAAKNTGELRAIASSVPAAKAAMDWAKMLDLAIKGERTVTSAHYFDLNNAIRLIKQYGYELLTPVSVNQPDDAGSTESTQGISSETSDRIRREFLGIEDKEYVDPMSEKMDE